MELQKHLTEGTAKALRTPREIGMSTPLRNAATNFR